jgi:hypothetical protein
LEGGQKAKSAIGRTGRAGWAEEAGQAPSDAALPERGVRIPISPLKEPREKKDDRARRTQQNHLWDHFKQYKQCLKHELTAKHWVSLRATFRVSEDAILKAM